MLDRLTRWKYFQLLSGVYLAMFLIRVAFGLVIITFGRYVTANDFIFGILVSSAPALELVTVIFTGFIVDRYGRKGVLLAGLGLGAASLYLLALAKPNDLLLIGLSQAVHGIAAGLILVTTLAIITAYASAATRGREMGIFNFVNMFGWFAGFALGTVLLDVVSDLRYTFVLAGFLATIGLVYGHLNIREPKRASSAEVERLDFKDLARVFSNPRVQVLAAAWLIVFMFIGGLIAFFSRVVVPEEAALEVVEAATPRGTRVAAVILGIGALFMATQIVAGKLSDRYGRESMLLAGAIGYLGFLFTITFGATLEPAFAAKNGLVVLLLLVTSVLTLAFAPAGLAALADEATKRTEGTTMSAYSIVLNVGMIMAPTVVGGVKELGGINAVLTFYIVTGFLLVGLILYRIYQVRQDRAPQEAVQVPVGEARSR